MNLADAQRSLEVYKTFLAQTHSVISFLESAKDFQRMLSVDIPTLKIVSFLFFIHLS